MKSIAGLIVAAVLVAGGYVGWHALRAKPQTADAPPSVPVTVAAAKQVEVPVYLRGIGTVRALNAVEIHPQVTGVLMDVPVREGEEVKKGAVLAVIDPRPFQAALDKVQAQRQQDQAQLDNANTDLKRYNTLAQRDFASRQQVDTQSSSVARLTGVVAADDAEIETAKINLTYCVVRAPMDGRVGLRRVDPGNLVQANGTGAGLLSVVQDQPISVVFTLPETELPRVKQAMARGVVAVLADSSDMKSQLASGTLLTPDNTVDPASGTISAKANFDNTDGALTPGQFVSVRVQVDTAQGVAVPHEAIQHSQDGLFVLIVKPDKTADRRMVQVTYDDGTTSVLGKGLEDGDSVIIAGQTRVGTGTKVAAHETKPDGGAADAGAADRRAQK